MSVHCHSVATAVVAACIASVRAPAAVARPRIQTTKPTKTTQNIPLSTSTARLRPSLHIRLATPPEEAIPCVFCWFLVDLDDSPLSPRAVHLRCFTSSHSHILHHLPEFIPSTIQEWMNPSPSHLRPSLRYLPFFPSLVVGLMFML